MLHTESLNSATRGRIHLQKDTVALYELLTPISAMTANTLLNTQLHNITKTPGPPGHTD